MSFIWPSMLLFLLFIPLFVLRYFMLNRKRQHISERFGSLWLGQKAQNRQISSRRHLPMAFFLVSLTLLIIALARPQATVSLPRVGGTVILSFDVSGSMAADDMKPTRMEAAKVAARDFIAKQPINVLIGIVAFSDSGLSIQPPTIDREALIAAVNRLSPQRGTSLANGIFASLATLAAGAQPITNYYSNQTPTPSPTPTPMPKGMYTSGVIILLTDGENNQNPDPAVAAQAAADRGVRVYTVGIGSPAGVNLHVNGFNVHTRLDEAMLQQIAELTDGTYYNAETEQDLLKIYDNLNPQLVIEPKKIEVTSIFAGMSIVTLLIGGTFSLLWFSRLP